MRLLGFVLVALLGVITILGAHSLASLMQEVTVLMVTIFVGLLFVRSSSADHPEQAQMSSEPQPVEVRLGMSNLGMQFCIPCAFFYIKQVTSLKCNATPGIEFS